MIDYAIHPEYHSGETYATLALLELDTAGETGLGEVKGGLLLWVHVSHLKKIANA